LYIYDSKVCPSNSSMLKYGDGKIKDILKSIATSKAQKTLVIKTKILYFAIALHYSKLLACCQLKFSYNIRHEV